MSTIQVEDRVKRKLFGYAAKLQAASGKRVSLSEAIDSLLETRSEQDDVIDKEKLLSLFGALQGKEKMARRTMRELDREEEKSIERKYPRASRKRRS